MHQSDAIPVTKSMQKLFLSEQYTVVGVTVFIISMTEHQLLDLFFKQHWVAIIELRYAPPEHCGTV